MTCWGDFKPGSMCAARTLIFVVGIGKWSWRPCQPASLEIVRATYCDFRSKKAPLEIVRRLTVIFVVGIGKWSQRPCQPGRLAQIPRETPCSRHRWRLCERLTVIFVVGIGKWRQRPCQPASLEIVLATYCDFRRGNREVETATLSTWKIGADSTRNALHRKSWALANHEQCNSIEWCE